MRGSCGKYKNTLKIAHLQKDGKSIIFAVFSHVCEYNVYPA